VFRPTSNARGSGVVLMHGSGGIGPEQVVLGELFLGPAAVAFQREFPHVGCELTLLDGFVDLVAEGADLSIRLGTISDASIVRRRLGSMERLLVAAPGYLKKHGVPKRPHELADHRGVRFSGLPTGNALTLSTGDGPVTVEVPPSFLSNNAITLKQAPRRARHRAGDAVAGRRGASPEEARHRAAERTAGLARRERRGAHREVHAGEGARIPAGVDEDVREGAGNDARERQVQRGSGLAPAAGTVEGHRHRRCNSGHQVRQPHANTYMLEIIDNRLRILEKPRPSREAPCPLVL
jgi:hypothetical protein